MNQETLKRMPKIDLHCHLDGSLPLPCLEELLGRKVDAAEAQAPENCRSLADYLTRFDLPLSCMQTAQGLRKAAGDFLRSAAEEHMIYVEVRFAPLLSVSQGLDCGQVLEAVADGLREAERACGVKWRMIACAMRHHSLEDNWKMLRAARDFLGKGLGGVDLAGDEAAYPMRLFRELFVQARQMGLPVTLHAGECGSVENVREAAECGASRIGHGIALRGNPREIRLCREKQITLELCPTSNLQTRAVAQESAYPLREFLDAGLRLTINTDNRTVSGTTMTRELEFVQTRCGASDRELVQMTRYAAEAAFLEPEEKAALLRQIEAFAAQEGI